MPDDHDSVPRLAAPAPPPPMPTARQAQVAAKPTAAQPSGGWEVDPDRLREFADAVDLVRRRLRDVEDKVELMRSAAYTPKLGTSPVGTQLERKFTDRLDAPLDNPTHPTSGGLRPLLAEAMRRMNEFVATAEAAAREYHAFDEAAAQHMTAVDRRG